MNFIFLVFKAFGQLSEPSTFRSRYAILVAFSFISPTDSPRRVAFEVARMNTYPKAAPRKTGLPRESERFSAKGSEGGLG